MTISYPLSLPTVGGFKTYSISAMNAIGSTSSQYTYQSQIQEYDGDGWLLEVETGTMTQANAYPWIAFLTMLKGPKGTFLAGDPKHTTPQGLGGGTPLVNGASQTGSSLITDGWTISVNTLKAGDYFSIANTLYMNLQDVTADGSGNATFDIYPSLRTSPANDAALDLTSPLGTFRLGEGHTRLYTVDSKGGYKVKFQAIESL